MIKTLPGNLACSYILFYIEKSFDDNNQRVIPLYLTNLKLIVSVSKNSPYIDLLISKYNRHEIYITGTKHDILHIIYKLTQMFGMVVQPLSLDNKSITFNRFKNEGYLSNNDFYVSHTINESIWFIILFNMELDIDIPEDLVSINEF